MPSVRSRARWLVACLVVLATVVAPVAASAQTVSSRSFYRTTEDANLSGSVSCDGSGSGTYTVATEIAVTLEANGAIDPSGTVEVPAGGEATFTVSGENTLSLAGDSTVETLFDNTGCSADLTITAADGGSSTVSVRNSLRSWSSDRATSPAQRRVRGGRP